MNVTLPLPSPLPCQVLGSILGALKAIVNVIGMTRMTPPIKELLPRLTPILKNRHEKVRRQGRRNGGREARDRGGGGHGRRGLWRQPGEGRAVEGVCSPASPRHLLAGLACGSLPLQHSSLP